jgi:unconventional prefoldin RPB5 interactor 1
MAQPIDHLSDLDRHVQQLEGKVNQLRASLTLWQQWYIDYSALKEEVEQLPTDTPPHEQLRRIRRDFDSQRLTKKEINEIMGKHDLKAPEQIVNVLSRRLDYVEQNINTLNKSLETEENRLAAAAVVAHPDAGTDEESGLPLADIIEELDEDDNVVNFRLQGGADAEPRIVEALKKAGIQAKDLAETEAALSKSLGALELESNDDAVKKESAASPATSASSTPQDAPRGESAARKKSVSFADDTKTGDEAVEPVQSKAAQDLERLMQKAKEQEAIDLSSAVIPENESAEESKLRREMLEYGMSEIGPVVAELQLEEDYSGDEDDVDWIGSDDEFDEEETDDDAEDELGRSKRKVVTSDYMKRMQELEKRLSQQSAFTVGGSETKPKKLDEGIGRIAVVSESAPSTASAPVPTPDASKGKKSVSFASQLDIAPDTAPPPDTRLKERKIAHVGDIVEKVAEEETLKDPEEPPKRVSRFKKERPSVASSSHPPVAKLPPGPQQLPRNFGMGSSDRPADPAPPEETLATTVAERATIATPTEPDDLDDAVLYKAAALEYSRLRNQLIRTQGGNIDDETGLVPLDEELGGPKRQSKFKAARLTKLQ